MTPTDLANVARLRNLQSQAIASLNAIAWRISDTGDIRPSTEQWAVLWSALETANATLQALADELAAAQASAKEQRRRLRDVAAAAASKTEAP